MIDEEQKQGISAVTIYVRFTNIFFCVITVILVHLYNPCLVIQVRLKQHLLLEGSSLSYENTNGMFLIRISCSSGTRLDLTQDEALSQRVVTSEPRLGSEYFLDIMRTRDNNARLSRQNTIGSLPF